MSALKSQAEIDAFVAELRQTKGQVDVTEDEGETFIRTRDGDEYRFRTAKKKAI